MPAPSSPCRPACACNFHTIRCSRCASRGATTWRAAHRARPERTTGRIAGMLADVPEREERETLLIEEFIAGAEVAVEGLLSDGHLEILAIFDKPDPLDGPYFEETYYTTPSRLVPDVQAQIESTVAEACAVYGLREIGRASCRER